MMDLSLLSLRRMKGAVILRKESSRPCSFLEGVVGPEQPQHGEVDVVERLFPRGAGAGAHPLQPLSRSKEKPPRGQAAFEVRPA